MPDIIQLLPDAIANQIAAGEVVQRPASVVKELMENSIDAGSKSIQLIIKDAGKTLIQVVDDGFGMTEVDGRLCFERHATSKIIQTDDLFKIKTKGFRGEALASIAAIAQVELRTRARGEEVGVKIVVEGSEVKEQEPCSTAEGTSFSVRNIFYNTPARRNFLKSDAVETRHIIDEFQRVALAHPEVSFRMHNNGNETFHLPASSLRQRIVGVLGSKYNQRLVPVDVETDIVKIQGFIGKPEFSRKTRGEQFFFVNKRFIRSSFFHHSVMGAYEKLITPNSYPLYFLYMDVDPSQIDVNIHPTKTEIKFQDERSIYAILNSAVKQALGKYHIVPTIDFEQETAIQIDPLPRDADVKPPQVKLSPDYNPFEPSKKHSSGGGMKAPGSWEDLYSLTRKFEGSSDAKTEASAQLDISTEIIPETEEKERVLFQLGKKYLVTRLNRGLVVIHMKRALERIHFEKYMYSLEKRSGSSQQLLFPEHIKFNASDTELLIEILPSIIHTGLEVDAFGPREFIIRGVPSESMTDNSAQLLESFLEAYKNENAEIKTPLNERIARALARSSARVPEREMNRAELSDLSDKLFACEQPQFDPVGKVVIVTFTGAELDQKFE